MEKAIDHLAQTFPFKTAEWAAWSANMRPARLDGTWLGPPAAGEERSVILTGLDRHDRAMSRTGSP